MLSELVLAALPLLAVADFEPWTAPMVVRSQAPLFANRLSYLPGRLQTLPPGRGGLDVALTHVNVWAQMPGYFFDGEWTELLLRGRWGLPDAWELGAHVAAYRRQGGFLDGFIEGFHRLLGVTQARRDRFARDSLRVARFDADGTHEYLGAHDVAVGLGNPTVSLRKTLCPGPCADWPVVTAELALKLPLGSVARQFATPNVAAMLDIGLQTRVGSFLSLFAVTGFVFSPGPDRLYGVELAWMQKFLFAALQWHIDGPWSLLAHYLASDGVAERAVVAPLDRTTHEFLLGVRLAQRAWAVDVGAVENAIHDANTPDFGLHAGIRWVF